MDRYKNLLRLPGVRALLVLGLLARIPATAMGLALTFDVLARGLGFAQAGLVGGAMTVGAAVGSPISGRFVDRFGMRPVIGVTTLAQLIFWTTAWALPYPVLLVAALVAGVLALPVFGVIRQCVAAIVPEEHRQAGFALDSIVIEISYMAGPAAAVALSTSSLGSTGAMCLVGVGLVGAGVALYVLNPPTRSAAEITLDEARAPRREWFTPSLAVLLAVAAVTTFLLTASELAIVSALRAGGDMAWTGLVIALWCCMSVAGGLVYGGLPRRFSPLAMIATMAALTIPVALFGGLPWWGLVLVLIPSGVFCAPVMSTTVDAISRQTPAAARGEVMGLHGTALTIGIAVASPIAGAVIDGFGPRAGFVLAGGVALILALVAVPFARRAPAPQPADEPALVA